MLPFEAVVHGPLPDVAHDLVALHGHRVRHPLVRRVAAERLLQPLAEAIEVAVGHSVSTGRAVGPVRGPALHPEAGLPAVNGEEDVVLGLAVLVHVPVGHRDRQRAVEGTARRGGGGGHRSRRGGRRLRGDRGRRGGRHRHRRLGGRRGGGLRLVAVDPHDRPHDRDDQRHDNTAAANLPPLPPLLRRGGRGRRGRRLRRRLRSFRTGRGLRGGRRLRRFRCRGRLGGGRGFALLRVHQSGFIGHERHPDGFQVAAHDLEAVLAPGRHGLPVLGGRRLGRDRGLGGGLVIGETESLEHGQFHQETAELLGELIRLARVFRQPEVFRGHGREIGGESLHRHETGEQGRHEGAIRVRDGLGHGFSSGRAFLVCRPDSG